MSLYSGVFVAVCTTESKIVWLYLFGCKYNLSLYSYSGMLVIAVIKTREQAHKYNGNTTHDWGVQRLYNGKYNVFELVFKRVTVTRSYNAVQT